MKQPYCRWCGKPIPKRTDWKVLVTDPESMKYGAERKLLVQKLPQTKAEAQALFNQSVIAVKRHKPYHYATDTYSDEGIDTVSLWDGESYVDKFFCSKTTCAVRMGYSAAREPHSLSTKAYREAVAAAEEKALAAERP